MRIPPCYRVLTLLLSSIVFGGVLGAQSPVGVFATHTEVGRASGSASYDPQRQTYLVAGSGQNMWGSRDDFHFVWKRISGNFILSTRARFIGAGVEERSEEHTSELQSQSNLVCRLLLEKKKKNKCCGRSRSSASTWSR